MNWRASLFLPCSVLAAGMMPLSSVLAAETGPVVASASLPTSAIVAAPAAGSGAGSFGGTGAGNLAEILQWKQRAAAGDVAAQVALGDLFSRRQQYSEAVVWHRAAATNGEVTAQLALAACLIAGRGVAENRSEAAYWMRRAADGVERGGAGPASGGLASAATAATGPTAARGAVAPIILTRAGASGASPAKNLFTNAPAHSTRSGRDDTLAGSEPVLQERTVGLQSGAPPTTASK